MVSVRKLDHAVTSLISSFYGTGDSKDKKALLLHGNFDIWVKEAKNLPNKDLFRHGSTVSISSCTEISQKKRTSDPYVIIELSGATIGRTFVIKNCENPVWMQQFSIPVAHNAGKFYFFVKDSNVVHNRVIGTVEIPCILSGTKIEGTFEVLDESGNLCSPGAALTISVQYTPVDNVPLYRGGVGAGPDYYEVPGTYFPLRRGVKVTLYQDAHVHDGYLPNLKLDNDVPYMHGSCWADIFDGMKKAKHLIYIAGWSIYHKVRLVRDGGNATESILGEFLKMKAEQGVEVVLLVWDDFTSYTVGGHIHEGTMKTHDKETQKFFKGSSVQVILCRWHAETGPSHLKNKEAGFIYSHHQKTVIVDADAGDGKRKITAFLGGFDLAMGRYDTPKHPLFTTSQTEHKDDFHNPTFKKPSFGCPREPWHDLHCQIDGPAAYDVLTNFEERLPKASELHGLRKLKGKLRKVAPMKIKRPPEIIGMGDAPCLSQDDAEVWHSQIFRSIDSNSVKDFPDDPRDATTRNLACEKNLLVDRGIHTAYVTAIRAAKRYIYIENQYFIGSSCNWTSFAKLGADNLIPREIALKIASKIRANERFSAYVVIPMWPEGVPTGVVTQRILFWQHHTMKMMYEEIYNALVEAELEEIYEPQDYLVFFCLGNREAQDRDGTSIAGSSTTRNTPEAKTRNSRRFMIYVHSKGMVVDDEYVILGSANINQRSLDGARDTEIAMGAYQPHHTWASKQSSPHGQIYGYRKSLWAEHIGDLEECFEWPESLECMRRVRSLSEPNWKQYADEEVTEMKGHLLKYPVQVDRKGNVNPLPGCETFPDVGGSIVGGLGKHLSVFQDRGDNLTI
ncbi:LOW QUALITY PROTEIN: hypothetical protein RJ640_002430 [Escallonia rubra]|uniref:Phospholipase D n=1 Tax=Escallonia rubra TaxID=112253 RepID=A0AA88R345_9ASTE|nr:LOW QUALITY PROTEIN: hypothetical protein RJ640_002430 [Escallonia rubra]